jgi:selenocysteine lyase/cysteine desulfurase
VWPSQGAERVAAVKEQPMPQKLEAGNPAMVVILFLEKALDLILETGIERIENHARDLSDEVSQGLAALDINVITPAARARRSGNTCFLLEDAPALVNRLAEHQVYVWGEYGRVRVSGHLYNGSADVVRLCDALKESL